MAYHSTIANTGGVSFKSFFTAIGAFFVRIGEALMTASANSGRMRKVEFLQAKSDADLAKMGLKRDDIVHHVFRDLYYL
jgi:hypothetical protein